jgi:competence protein ComEA
MVDRITAARNEGGGFSSVEELRTVPGIGPARMERLRPWVSTNGGLPLESPPAAPQVILDINQATAEQLTQLPGIGAKLAQRIVDERAKAPFRSVEDLRRVYGIGAKTLERIRPHVTVTKE